jgi:hypothetical protein
MIDDKVDKVDGKGLSTNDFTDEYKRKLDEADSGVNENTVLITTDDIDEICGAVIQIASEVTF